MAHGVLDLVYDHQGGQRGHDGAFASGMLMAMARRPLGDGTLQLRASLSPDPIMGPHGYPLLLASGETANGDDRLIDRQHPHDLFMELSASVSQNIGSKSSVFVYAGLPGEPAFGPPAFMHREAIMDSPEAPISHHWLDSTHISFGVVTGGLVLNRTKIEVSRFNAREPDQRRWNMETGPLDSTAFRLSWNPTGEFALQGSWGRFKDPNNLSPASTRTLVRKRALRPRGRSGWKLAGTLAGAGRRRPGTRTTLMSRRPRSSMPPGPSSAGGNTDNRALEGARAGLSSGQGLPWRSPRLRSRRTFVIGAGGLVALKFVPVPLAAQYGGNNPIGAMGFFRLKLDD